MKEQQQTTGKVALTYGTLLGVLSITQAVILYITNSLLDQNWVTAVVGFAIMIGMIVYGQMVFKKGNGGYMNFKEALKVGVGIAITGALIAALYNFIFLTFIEPGFVDLIVEKQREAMIEQSPNMTEAQIEQGLAMAGQFARPWVQASFQIVGGIFFGFIISLISGLILKTENPYQD
ncbi:DUF4199 domain-containing protein [Leeuwenhoekiella sp. MAR_2009_132]|uniref:DUF4199 domain-containing protein n=1 Tax=Leeuwenhoekiella sp. MAR_2009_132 TaxID=1392489 RepID=UPI000490A8F2|nr:DUF4199 domain-containing protein [Leeuwenhoekiella sp. MAR_2009_132]